MEDFRGRQEGPGIQAGRSTSGKKRRVVALHAKAQGETQSYKSLQGGDIDVNAFAWNLRRRPGACETL